MSKNDFCAEEMMKEKKQPKFRLEFNAFASYGKEIEASFVVSPKFELVAVSDIHHSKDTARVLNLIFRRTNSQKLGRRVFSLKKEFEQTPQGEVTFDSPVCNKKSDDNL